MTADNDNKKTDCAKTNDKKSDTEDSFLCSFYLQAIQLMTVVVGRKTDSGVCKVLTCADVGKANYLEFPAPTKLCPLVPGDIHWANYVMGVIKHYVGNWTFISVKSLFYFC